MKIWRHWKILLMILSFGVRAKCDALDDLVISVLKLLHEKVDKISLEQVRTNEKVDQLQSQIESLESKIGHGCNTAEQLDGSISSPVAILITGGNPIPQASRSVEALNSDGTPLCTLPDLPAHTRLHTMEGNMLCIDEYCQYFEFGLWKVYSWYLSEDRGDHLSWKRPDGGIQLLGGGIQKWLKTTEIVNSTGTQPGFNLKFETKLACVIKLQDYFIITGGRKNMRSVFQYDVDGEFKILPNLDTGRLLHGCGHFYSGSNELVYMVAGGVDVMMDSMDSVEILPASGDSWRYVTALPSPRSCMRGVTIDNQLFMTGGVEFESLKDILRYDPDSNLWVSVGEMKVARSSHAVSVLPLEDVEPFCSS